MQFLICGMKCPSLHGPHCMCPTLSARGWLNGRFILAVLPSLFIIVKVDWDLAVHAYYRSGDLSDVPIVSISCQVQLHYDLFVVMQTPKGIFTWPLGHKQPLLLVY